MKFIYGLNHRPHFKNGSVVTIGNFDGVHLGHQSLLRTVANKAEQTQLPSVLITFEPQPREFFAKALAPVRLTRLREKIQGVSQSIPTDYFLALKFNQALASLTPQQFIQEVLHRKLNLRHIIVGEDFCFGAKRAGTVLTLKEYAQAMNYQVEVLPQVQEEGIRVSSTRVRMALASGDLDLATSYLGRPYSLCGPVIHGDHRGRQWGFPTANIPVYRKKPPLSGIFAVRVNGEGLDGAPGVASLGVRPTIGDNQLLLEVYLFDKEVDLYGKTLEVLFFHKLRDEEKFDNLEDLKAQIQLDAINAKALL